MISTSLRALYETAQCGSIRKAADKMGVAPSSVSRQIAVLEHQIGTALLGRGPSGARLTHAGNLVVEFAGPVLMDYEALRNDLNDMRGKRRRLIRIGATASVLPMDVARTLAEFQKAYETTTFQFEYLSTENAVKAVINGDCDVAVTLCAELQPEIDIIVRYPEPSVLVCTADHPLAQRKMVSVQEFAEVDFAVLSESYLTRRNFNDVCRRAAIQPNIVLESGNISVLLSYVANSGAVTLLPLRTLTPDVYHDALRGMPVDSPALNNGTIDLVVSRKRRMPRFVRTFVEWFGRELARQVADPQGTVTLG